ncbi:MAG: hypothetical protein ABI779_15515 [Acidobacteriota bacterium]
MSRRISRVLIVEPYADLRAEIAATLRREHYTCDAVASADHATIQLSRNAYAYVVVDLEVIGGDLVSALDPSSRVILLTDNDSEPIEGADSTLQKPFSREELIARFTS